MSTIIKTFKTPMGNYIYDRETNSILSVTQEQYEAFCRICKNAQTNEDVKVLNIFQDNGYCKDGIVEHIEHPQDKFLEFHLEKKVQKLTLQVTQNCNLRCAYCCYTGEKYNNREHSNKTMPFEIMKQSVDFLMQHSTNSPKVDIGFYGGEPLLEFQKIRKLIGYIEERYPYKKITYSMTTNGTLFNTENIQFLIEKNINVMISLDGPRELHNINRVYANGQGSFDKIMENLSFIKFNYPDFFKRIGFNTVISPEVDFKCVNDFFAASEIIKDNNLRMGILNDYYLEKPVQYSELYFINYRIQRTKWLLWSLGFISKKNVSGMFTIETPRILRMYKQLSTINGLAKVTHPGGPCIPGAMRPMVDVNGNLYPCERVSEESDIMKIGNIFTGFDINKARKILNPGKLTEEKCKNCWNFIYCGICAAAADDTHQLIEKKRLEYCERSMSSTLELFKTICLLKENNYDFENAEDGYYA